MTEEVSKEQIKGENGTGIDEAKRLKEKKGALPGKVVRK